MVGINGPLWLSGGLCTLASPPVSFGAGRPGVTRLRRPPPAHRCAWARSPVIGAGRVWSLDTRNGILYTLDPATGASLGSVSVGTVNRFATPALYDNSVIVGTLSGVTAFSWN
jgi:hypothetical protein